MRKCANAYVAALLGLLGALTSLHCRRAPAESGEAAAPVSAGADGTEDATVVIRGAQVFDGLGFPPKSGHQSYATSASLDIYGDNPGARSFSRAMRSIEQRCESWLAFPVGPEDPRLSMSARPLRWDVPQCALYRSNQRTSRALR